MNPFVACAFGIAAAGVISVIKQLRPELAGTAAATAGVLILIYVAQGLSPLVEFIRSSSADCGTEICFSVMLKALAVSLSCKMSADICRDCGESSLASRVELAGKTGIVILSLPIISQLLQIAKDMLK